MRHSFFLWKKIALTLLYFSISVYANSEISTIQLPNDLNKKLPFQVHTFSKPTFKMLWTMPNMACTVPLPINTELQLTQGQKIWSLKSSSIAHPIKSDIFQLWFQAASNSKNILWKKVPTTRLFLLASLCLPILLFSTLFKNKIKALLPLFLLILFAFLPNYKNKLVILGQENWNIEQSNSDNWIQFENGLVFSLSPLQLKNDFKENSTPSLLIDWLTPKAKKLGVTHQLWSSEHILTF